jgi:hypothetical protein
VNNPVEVISRSSKRLARLAVGQQLATWILPLALTLAFALSLDWVRDLLLDAWGRVIAPRAGLMLVRAVFALASIELLGLAWLAFKAWRRADDFVATAEKIDDAVRGRQEVITLATLANPAQPGQKGRRSPLFAMLWRRVAAHLELFEPRRQFRFNVKQPLKRSSALTGALALLLGLATIASTRLPSPPEAAAYRMRELAARLDASGATPSSHELAEALRDVAKDLENPRLPPQQKIAELQSIKQELAKLNQQNASAQSGSGKGDGSGNGSGNGSGGGSGKGEGKGQGATGKGAGAGAGGPNKGGKDDQQSIKLQNDIAKAEAKLEEENNSGNQSQTARNQGQTGSGLAPQQGSNPHQSGPQSKPNGTGTVELPSGGKLTSSQAPPSSSGTSPRSDNKGSQGDTHLGDFPKAANYDRFYKLGDKGPPIDIKDARYVTFRLPTSVVAAGGDSAGRMVQDAESPAAKTPYTNAPLKEQRVAASPDEQQLLPPRYRDLIR